MACRGGGTFFRRFYRCHSTHGVVGLDEALEKSCNTLLLHPRQHDGRGRHQPLGGGVRCRGAQRDRPARTRPRAWSRRGAGKRERFNEPWYPGETISVAIGQGAVSVTPMSLAVMMATVANGGSPRGAPSAEGGPPRRRLARAGRLPDHRPRSLGRRPSRCSKRGLWMVVNNEGTGGRARIAGRDVMGKSGTAQVVSLSGRANANGVDADFRDHGWFVFGRPARGPADRRRGLRRALGPRLPGRAHRSPHHRDAFRQAGRPCRCRCCRDRPAPWPWPGRSDGVTA